MRARDTGCCWRSGLSPRARDADRSYIDMACGYLVITLYKLKLRCRVARAYSLFTLLRIILNCYKILIPIRGSGHYI